MSKIFVAIASYRDPECQWTVKDLFDAASHPENITVGICWQFDAVDDQACFVEPYSRPEQVRVMPVSLNDTLGACWAKAQALSLVGDEDYVLLIDSHMRFAASWDVDIVETLKRTGNNKAFLSTYPAGYIPPNDRRFNTPRLAPVKFFQKVMSQNSVIFEMPRPLESYLVAGGYLFGQKEMFKEVPYDPHIYFIGEEITFAARLFTHGWNGYTPDRCLIHHYYERKTDVRHWDDQKEVWPKLNDASYNRVRHLLGVERTNDEKALIDIDRYGLGKVRTLTEFQFRIGVNFNAQYIDRSRYERLPEILDSIENPKPVVSVSETGAFKTAVCRCGYLMVPKRDSYIGKSIIEYGEWIAGLSPVLSRFCSAGDVVVEVGAGFGAHTIELSRLTGRSGRVTAYEQSSEVCHLLHANVALNQISNLSIRNARVGALPGAALIGEPDFENEGNFGMVSAKSATEYASNLTPIVQLDTENLGKVRLLYLDSPGSAMEILQGASQLIDSQKPNIIVNVDNKSDADFCLNYFSEIGYRFWWYFIPFFSEENFFKSSTNVFGKLHSKNIIATFSSSIGVDDLAGAFDCSIYRDEKTATETWVKVRGE